MNNSSKNLILTIAIVFILILASAYGLYDYYRDRDIGEEISQEIKEEPQDESEPSQEDQNGQDQNQELGLPEPEKEASVGEEVPSISSEETPKSGPTFLEPEVKEAL